jgi:hypothetical protein
MKKIYPELLPSFGTVSRSCEAGVIALYCSKSYTCRLHSVVVVVDAAAAVMEIKGNCKTFLFPNIYGTASSIARAATTPA